MNKRQNFLIDQHEDDKHDRAFESDPRFIARIQALRNQYRKDGGPTIEEVRKELSLPTRRKPRKTQRGK